jgi:hypothetical protein
MRHLNMWSFVAFLVYAAINLGGSHAVDSPTVDNPSPISDATGYHPDQHDCPLTYVDYSNMHSWIPFHSVDRLQRCSQPMLLQFSLNHALDGPDTRVLIRACSLGGSSLPRALPASRLMDNPKKDKSLFDPRLRSAPACSAAGGSGVDAKLELAAAGDGRGEGGKLEAVLDGMQNFFSEKDNCDETVVFVRYNNAVAAIYIGANLGKSTVESALKALTSHRSTTDIWASKRMVAQLCGSGRPAEQAFGVSIDTTGDLVAVQKIALEWTQGKCASDASLKPAGVLPGIKVLQTAAGAPGNGTSLHSQLKNRSKDKLPLHERAACRLHEVKSQEDCPKLATICGISPADFTKFNSWRKDMCATLQVGDFVCCSSGDPPPTPKPPPKNSDGTCATHLIANGDTCDALTRKYGFTVANLENWNKGKTWGWTDCPGIMPGYKMCISDGSAPLPAPQEGTECGPMVPNTKRPSDLKISLADINPCPLNACCTNWGFCGPYSRHCDIHAPEGGSPGSVRKGFANTCISNCGLDIKQNSGPPSSFHRIGYYESFNFERDCLHLQAKNANTDGSYTHIHWAFADIDTATWKPIIKDPKNQWADFKSLPVKRIVSFGGWAHSTEPATFKIIRTAINDNYEVFTSNLAQFAKDEGIDVVDIDWEYPGVSFRRLFFRFPTLP